MPDPTQPAPLSEDELKAIEKVLTEGRYFVGDWSGKQLDRLVAEVRRLQAADAEVRERPCCAWCGKVFRHNFPKGSPESLEVGRAHMETCEKHPLCAALKELAAVRAAVEEESKRADKLQAELETQAVYLTAAKCSSGIAQHDRDKAIERADRAEAAARELRTRLSDLFNIAVVARANGGEPYADVLASTAWLSTGGEDG